jgi:hypothetical protein
VVWGDGGRERRSKREELVRQKRGKEKKGEEIRRKMKRGN